MLEFAPSTRASFWAGFFIGSGCKNLKRSRRAVSAFALPPLDAHGKKPEDHQRTGGDQQERGAEAGKQEFHDRFRLE